MALISPFFSSVFLKELPLTSNVGPITRKGISVQRRERKEVGRGLSCTAVAATGQTHQQGLNEVLETLQMSKERRRMQGRWLEGKVCGWEKESGVGQKPTGTARLGGEGP